MCVGVGVGRWMGRIHIGKSENVGGRIHFFGPKAFLRTQLFFDFFFSLCGRRLRKGVECCFALLPIITTKERTNELSERKEKAKTKCFKDSNFDICLYMIAAGLVREEERGNMYCIELNMQPWERG